jgi:hypothetical protein
MAEVSLSLMEIDGKDYSIAIISDITARKRVEKQFDEYQQWLKALAS